MFIRAEKSINPFKPLACLLKILEILKFFNRPLKIAAVGVHSGGEVDLLQAGEHFSQLGDRIDGGYVAAHCFGMAGTGRFLVEGQGLEVKGHIAVLGCFGIIA